MNILPVVCAFLVVFGICAHSFFWQYKTSWAEFFVYEGRMRTERAARGLFAKKEFYSVRLEKKHARSASSKDACCHESRRDKYPPSSLGRVSIAFLFAKQPPDYFQSLCDVLTGVIKELYAEALFAEYSTTRAFEKELVDQWIFLARTHPDNKTFATLFPEDKVLAELHYKMLKGAPGKYPPLEAYFTLEERDHPIYFHFAPRYVLHALFGVSLTNKMLLKEEDKWKKNPKHKHYTLTRAELDVFFLDQGGALPLHLDEILDYTYKRDRADRVVVTDKTTGIELHKVKKKSQVKPVESFEPKK